jgi:DNA-binding transcriptional MocR family regulator
MRIALTQKLRRIVDEGAPQSMLDNLELPDNDRPIYQRLADAIGQRIASGELVNGDRLPPHREIARALGLNVTTVTRAFSALQQRGLVEARPGRGTRIASRETEEGSFKSAPSDEPGLIDLSINRPPTTAYRDALATLLPRLSKDRHFGSLQDYHPPEGPAWARATVAAWLDGIAGGGDASRVVLTDGAQHGLACVLRAVAQPGDVILADSITYQGINALSRSQGLDLRGLPMDREGMRPDAFERACAAWRPRAVFLVPSLHNPTTITLSEERRHALAAVARRHNVLIIEDDVYRPLLDTVIPSFASMEPELTIHISCLSKCIAPGLRYGVVVAPRAVLGHIEFAMDVALVKRPVCPVELGFYMTPMRGRLRVAGTVELGGLAAPSNPKRIALLERGFRPSLPDSRPVIGRRRRYSNLILAFGHGHLGMTLAGVTSRAVAGLIEQRNDLLDLSAFRADRFG